MQIAIDGQKKNKSHGALYNLLNNPSSERPLSLVIQAVMFLLILISTFVFMIETMPQFYTHQAGGMTPMWFVEAVCIGCFTVELVLRFAVRLSCRVHATWYQPPAPESFLAPHSRFDHTVWRYRLTTAGGCFS